LFDVLEDERLALVRRELIERTLDFLSRRARIAPIVDCFRIEHRLVVHDTPLSARAPSRRRATLIRDDREDPGAEPGRVSALVQMTERAKPRALQRFVGIEPVPEHAHGEPHVIVAMAANEKGESVEVTAKNVRDEQRV
jgi:hypothetical protein